MRRVAGFSVLELVVAMGITLTVTAAVCTMMSPVQGAWAAEPEVADLQQRLRVAAEAMSRDLVSAGAGPLAGPNTAALIAALPPLMPFRRGGHDDPPGSFKADTITVLSVVPGAAATVLRAPSTDAAADLLTSAEAGCAVSEPLCGFVASEPVVIFDDSGAFDVVTVTAVQNASIGLQHSPLSRPYRTGAVVAPLTLRTYWLKIDRTAGTSQLMQYDGGVSSDVPVVDHVVALAFEYFGDPDPARLTRPIDDPAGPWTTYGPKPPAPDVQTTAYGMGENCAFSLDPSTGDHVPRMATLGAAGTALVRLTPAQLTDGPWCPDALSDNRYDVDLLRIRRVAVAVRVETASAALRGPAGLLFANGGGSPGGARLVPDQQLRFDIAPRNVNRGR